jgi:hypothetical protein
MEYRKIKGYENYEVSENGDVRNIKTGRIMKPYLQQGYYRVSLIKSKNVKKSEAIHRLVAIAFIPNKDNKPIIDHINQNKSDNNKSNLRWSTYKENANNVDLIKRRQKTDRIKFKIGLLFCENIKKWIVKTKNKKVEFDDVSNAFEYLKLKSRGCQV